MNSETLIMNIHRRQLGMTLIEIMISLLIGAFLIGGVLQIFTYSKQTYRMQEGLSRLQENGRFALDFLTKDIRMAGYRTCLDTTVSSALAGTNNTGINTSDTITTRMSFSGCTVTPAFTVISYTINNGAGGQPALFRQTDASAPAELIEGVENIQILYGEDANSDNIVDYYVPVGTAGLNMNQVISLRISLLIHSFEDNLTAQPRAYTYNGATTTPTDRRLRKVFSSTIAVRNRLP